MKLSVAVVAMCGLLAVASRADAKDASARQVLIEARMIEIGGMGQFDYARVKFKDADQSAKITSITILPVVGYFFTGTIEAEIAPIIALTSTKPPGASKSDTETHFGALVHGVYNFSGAGSVVPFIFAGGGFVTNSYTGAPSNQKKVSLVLPEGGLGIKALVTDQAAIRLEVYARNIVNSGGTSDRKELEVGARAGLLIFLKPHLIGNHKE